MKKKRKVMTTCTILLLAVCAAAAWRVGWQPGEQKKPAVEGTYEEDSEMEEDIVTKSYVIYRESPTFYLVFSEEGTPYDPGQFDADEIYGENGEKITEDELDTGDRVNVTTNGEVMECYPPVFGKVLRIEVTKKADETEKEECTRRYEELLAEALGEAEEPDPSEPPVMRMSYTEGETVCCAFLTRGGYRWRWTNEKGETVEAVADAPFITEWSEPCEIRLSDPDTELELLPESGADQITVTCLDIDGKEVPKLQEKEVENREGRWYLNGVKPGYYYLLHVNWGEVYVEYGFKSL